MEARRSLTQAVGDVLSDSLDLIQTELRLARVEAGEKLNSVVTLAATGGAGAMLLLLGAILLLLGAVRWLAIAGLPEEWGLLVVGGIAAALGFVLIAQARQRASADALMPKRTISELQADAVLVRRNGHG
jgi:hypothetical protein